MTRPPILWISLLASVTLWNAEASECRITPHNTTFKVTETKEYCTESLDTYGCNAGRISMMIQGSSECRNNQDVNATCSIALWIKTKRHPKGIGETLHMATMHSFIDGTAEAAKEYVSWSRLVDPVRDLEVLSVKCSVGSSEKRDDSDDTPDTVTPTIDDTGDAQESESAARRTHELEMLKEQNRAKELEIEALKLKIKLKELESEATR